MKGRDYGQAFEQIFLERGQLNGLFVRKNPLSCRHVWGGRLQLVKGLLDFMLVSPHGIVGFFDTKSFGGDKFAFSEIDEGQLKMADTFNKWNVPAGFVVYFRDLDAVVYFKAGDLYRKGPRSSFGVIDGKYLGTVFNFDLKVLVGA